MKLHYAVEKYISLKQAMGMRFQTPASMLRGFARAMGARDIAQIDLDAVQAYLRGRKSPNEKFYILTQFYQFAIARGYATSSPLPTVMLKRSARTFLPHIYTLEEIRRLLATAGVLDHQRGRLSAFTFRTLVTMLYGTGLRISEALRLTFADVNLTDALLIIRDSKFYKTRWVPLGPKLCALLKIYSAQRRQWSCPAQEDSAFFATHEGTPIGQRSCAEYVFRRLCNLAGIRRSDGASYQPRLHDLRHTFAVERLVSWYRQGADTQILLPSLATYLGHKDIACLQRYLTMTPELLDQASRRFERYALSEVNHV